MCHRLLAAAVLLGAAATLAAQTPGSELNRDTYEVLNDLTIVQGDFNHDGKPDLVLGGGSSDQGDMVTLRLGNGDGTFQPPITVGPVNNTIYDMAAADMNGDGNPDVKGWDASGRSFRSDRTVTVYNGTPYPACPTAFETASICLPGGTTSSSPVHILANGWAPWIPTAAQLYIDGDLIVNNDNCNNVNGCTGGISYVDTTQTLSSGSHTLVFKLWDADGDLYTAQKTVTVN